MNNERGQTSVEYILLIAVMVTIISSLFGNLQEFLIENPDSVFNSYLNSFENSITAGQDDGQNRYKTFRLRR